MPIKLWSNEAQDFVDANPDAPTRDELDEFLLLYRALPPKQKAEMKAFAEALLARRDGQEPH